MKKLLKLFYNQTQPKSVENKIKTKIKQIPLTQLPGIGRHTPKALAMYGITTVNQFAKFQENEVVALLGKSGLKLLGNAKKTIAC
jgi:nucleotidyltransferase/DNA polymerase involved in DNA repair